MCVFCKANEVISSTTTHVVDYKGCLIIVKNVPCEKCVQCDEIFISDDVAIRLEKIVDSAKKTMQEISVLDYNKVA